MATDTQVIAQFSYRYKDAEGAEVAFSEGEQFLLLNKATDEWWKVKRVSSDSSLKSIIYVPATYVKELPLGSPINTQTQDCRFESSADNHDYMNLDAFRACMQRADSTTDSDYSYSDNDTASSLGTSPSPRVLNGSTSPNPQSNTAELRKSLNLEAVLVRFVLLCLFKTGHRFFIVYRRQKYGEEFLREATVQVTTQNKNGLKQ